MRWIWTVLAALVLAGCDDVAPPRQIVDRAFPSAAAPPAEPVVVWAVGDGADGGAVSRRLARRIAADDPDQVIYLGDVYERGTAEEFRTNMTGAYRGLLNRMLATPGNHEWPRHDTGYDPYWERVTGEPTPPWYAVRLGSWELLSLNSEAPHGRAGTQLRWLRARLRRRGGTCRIAFWHRPRFSAGKHGDQMDVAPLWDAVAGRAVLVLGGHDHNQQRFKPVSGTTLVVSGAGGRERYGVDETDPRIAFADDDHFGATRMVLRPRRLELSFVTVGGRVLDRARLRCSG